MTAKGLVAEAMRTENIGRYRKPTCRINVIILPSPGSTNEEVKKDEKDYTHSNTQEVA